MIHPIPQDDIDFTMTERERFEWDVIRCVGAVITIFLVLYL